MGAAGATPSSCPYPGRGPGEGGSRLRDVLVLPDVRDARVDRVVVVPLHPRALDVHERVLREEDVRRVLDGRLLDLREHAELRRREPVWTAYTLAHVIPFLATGALLMIPLTIFIVMPYFPGDWHASNLEYVHRSGGFSDIRIALMWLFIMCWSAYGIEVGATFAPEYKDTARDTKRALRSAALFSWW